MRPDGGKNRVANEFLHGCGVLAFRIYIIDSTYMIYIVSVCVCLGVVVRRVVCVRECV